MNHAFRAALGIAIVLSAAACADRSETVSAEPKGRLVISGSNTFGEELAPRLIAAYRAVRPNVSVALDASGSGTGFLALREGRCDLAAATRNPTADEAAEFRARGIELREYVIGYDGVAVIVNAANPVGSLTREQVKDIFTGRVQNWRRLAGADAAIRVCTRDPVSGTNLGFRELAMNDEPYVADARQFTSYAELADAVRRDAGSVGYASMHLARAAGVKAVRIGRAEPNEVSVNEGWYPYARALCLYSNGASESAAARDFARFAQARAGQRIVAEMGLVRRFERRLASLVPD